jgi:hypothetical protein
MKRLIYLTYLALLALALLSCEKEQIVPQTAEVSTGAALKASTCNTYSYVTKTGVKHFGIARTDYVLIGFDPALTLADQERILKRYNIFAETNGDFFMDSGIITVVKLKSNATCAAVESFLQSLEGLSAVNFALPVFNPDATQQGIFEWVGLTNEFIVTIPNPGAYANLQRLAQSTNTQIITNLDANTYILSTDKNSAGNALEMSTLFNQNRKISNAEPNLLFQLVPFGGTKQMPKRTPQSALKKETLASL